MESLFRQIRTGLASKAAIDKIHPIQSGPSRYSNPSPFIVTVFAPHIRAGNDEEFGRLTFAIDVAQIGAGNAPNNVDPTERADLFARDTAILSGTIYPKGKLQFGVRLHQLRSLPSPPSYWEERAVSAGSAMLPEI